MSPRCSSHTWGERSSSEPDPVRAPASRSACCPAGPGRRGPCCLRSAAAHASSHTVGRARHRRPCGWLEHELDDSGVFLALPEAWIVLDAAALADPAVQSDVEERFEGAEALFSQLAAQGRRARIVLLAIDARAAGTGAFPPIISVVAVEPALPPLLLEIGADFTSSALENAFSIELNIERTDMSTPLGDGIRIAFEHRVVTVASAAASSSSTTECSSRRVPPHSSSPAPSKGTRGSPMPRPSNPSSTRSGRSRRSEPGRAFGPLVSCLAERWPSGRWRRS